MTRTTMRTIRNSVLLGLAGLGAASALALSPTTAHAADPAIPNVPTSTATAPEQARIADYDGALQPNGYYCGPAATRIALSAHGQPPTFDALAQDLGTTRDGTKSIDDITRVLNQHTGDGRYTAVKFDSPTVTDEQTDKLRADIMAAINDGDPVVANIVGQVTDTKGETHRYAGGHYLTITGYSDNGHTVHITDPADRKGSNEYQLPIDTLADWMATRGYTS
jgi:hypothetical protein